MAKGLKGITIEIDGNTQPLNKALTEVNTNTRSLQTELKGVNTLLKLDPKNTELAAQKQMLLSQAVQQTEEKLKLLEQAQKEAVAAGKDINDEGYRDLQREIAATQSKLKDLKKEKEATGNAAEKLKAKLPSLSQALSMVGSAAKTAGKAGLQTLSAVVGGTMKAFAGFSTAVIGGATALGSLAVKQAETLDNIDKMSQRLGMSREEFQKWDFVLSQSGVDINSFQSGMKTLTKNMDAVSEGNKTAIANFKALGVEVQNADGTLKSQSQALYETIIALQKMPGSTEKARLAQELFGKQGQEIMPLLNSESGSVEDLMQKCEDLGIIINSETVDAGVKFKDTLDQMKRSAQGLFNTFVSTGVLETFTNGMETAMGAISDLMKAYNEDGLEGLLDQADDTVSDLVQQISDEVSDTVPELVEVATTVLTSLVTTLAENTPNIVNGLLPPLMSGFFDMISAIISTLPDLTPKLLQAAVSFFMGILTGLNTVIPQLAAQTPLLINQVTSSLTENLPQIIQSGVLILVNLINGITSAIPSLIEATVELFPVITTALLDNLPLITEAGLNLLVALITGIVQAIPQLIAMLPDIIVAIVNTLASMLPQIILTGSTLLESLISGISQAIPQLIAAAPKIVTAITSTLIMNLPNIISSGIQLIGALISGIIQAIPQIVAAIPKVVSAIFTTFRSVNWAELGENIISGIKDGVVKAAKHLAESVADAAKEALDAAKDALGIHSPSRVFRDQVGKQMAAGQLIGYEEGMKDNKEAFAAASRQSIPTTIDGYISTKTSTAQKEAATAAGGFTQNVTINSPRELDPSEISRLTKIQARQMMLRFRPT